MDVIDYAGPKKPFRWSALFIAAAAVVGGLLLAAVMMPSLNPPRGSSNRAKCASNLHQIGLAILLYCNDNNGVYPDSFETMMRDEQITSPVFICPSCDDTAATGATTQAARDGLADPTHVSYVYIGAGLNDKTAQPGQVIAYDKPGNHGSDGINILFGDGHAEFVNRAKSIQLIPSLATASWQQR